MLAYNWYRVQASIFFDVFFFFIYPSSSSLFRLFISWVTRLIEKVLQNFNWISINPSTVNVSETKAKIDEALQPNTTHSFIGFIWSLFLFHTLFSFYLFFSPHFQHSTLFLIKEDKKRMKIKEIFGSSFLLSKEHTYNNWRQPASFIPSWWKQNKKKWIK